MATVQYQKSSLNTYTLTSQTVTAGTPLVLQTIGEKSGCSINLSAGGTAVTLVKPGLYYVSVDAVFTDNSVAGDVDLSIYKNGVAIPGAVTTQTVEAAGTAFFSGATSTLVHVNNSCPCVNNAVSISFVNSGVSAIYDSLNVNVIKLA